jgi:hypothetical protein
MKIILTILILFSLQCINTFSPGIIFNSTEEHVPTKQGLSLLGSGYVSKRIESCTYHSIFLQPFINVRPSTLESLLREHKVHRIAVIDHSKLYHPLGGIRMKNWILITMFSIGSIYADRIILKNGKTINGTVESQTKGYAIISTKSGSKKIDMKDVISVVYVETKKSPKAKPIPEKKIVTSPPTPIPAETKTVILTEPMKGSDRERIVEKSEKVTVDKELTDNVMKKFEDADKRRAEQTKGEVTVLKDEIDYFKKLKDKGDSNEEKNNEFKKGMDKRMAGLEIRTRRLEKYLGMDETMVEYYQKPRSPWDLVWRSALFPGWGHRYAKEEYTGNTYSTTILILLPLYYLINYQSDAAEKAFTSSTQTKLISSYLQYQAVGIPANLSNAVLYRTVGNYQTGIDTINSQRELGKIFLNTALLIYLFQIGHAYFTGVEWAKTKPRNYSNEELMKPTGFNFQTKPDTNGFAGFRQNTQIGVEYKFSYTSSF